MMAFLTPGPITVSDKETTAKHNINILLTVFAKATGPLHPLPSLLEQELPGGWSSLHRWGKSSHCRGSMASASLSSPRATWGQARPLGLPLLLWLLLLCPSQVQPALGKCWDLQIASFHPDGLCSCLHWLEVTKCPCHGVGFLLMV